MFSLASTLALAGLAALAIPVLIHLFNPGKVPVVWVGNIHLIKAASKTAVTQWQIRRWLLLVLRLLLITLATLVVAQSFYTGSFFNTSTRLALVSPQWLAGASEQQFTQMSQQASEVLLLHPGFKTIKQQKQTLQSNSRFSHWSLLARLDGLKPRSQSFDIYVTDALTGFETVQKPTFRRRLSWHLLPSSAAESQPPPMVLVYGGASDPVTLQSLKWLGFKVQLRSDHQPAEGAGLILWLQPTPVSPAVREAVAAGARLILAQQIPATQNDADFIYQLSRLIQSPLPLGQKLQHPMVDLSQLNTSTDAMDNGNGVPLRRWLLICLVLVFMAERILSAQRASRKVADD